MTVGDNQRHKRLRLLLKKLNKDRKKQAKKTDILCNDLIGAQRDFIRKLKTISFTANFYESIVGMTELNTLLYTAAKQIGNEKHDTNIIFFLREAESFEIYLPGNDRPPALDKEQLADCFTPESMDNICKSNKICSLEDMYQLGLQGNLAGLNGTSAVTIPLGLFGSPLGFMFVYRSSDDKLTADETDDISAVTSGLSQAIVSCRALSRTAN